jgi:hypothetical protein
VPNDAEFLMLVAHDVDAYGDWLPTDVLTAQTYSQLKEILKQIAANADGIVIRASGHFDRLALELRLRPMTTEWSNL